MALRQTALIATAAYALTAVTLSAQGYSHGTAEAVITSANAIVAVIDSKEVSREYLNDGTSVTQDRISCKVQQIGPYYVLIAGISRATDGFDALLETKRWYQDDDSLDSFAQRLAIVLPRRLATILETLRAANGAAFDESFRNQDVLQLTLLGAESSKPRVAMVAFHASQSGAGLVAIDARLYASHPDVGQELFWNKPARAPMMPDCRALSSNWIKRLPPSRMLWWMRMWSSTQSGARSCI